MWCCHYFDRCPSLLCNIFDLPISLSTYHCSHISKNGGSKVVHLISYMVGLTYNFYHVTCLTNGPTGSRDEIPILPAFSICVNGFGSNFDRRGLKDGIKTMIENNRRSTTSQRSLAYHVHALKDI